MFIQTERTNIRPFVSGDLSNLAKLCTSAEAMLFIPPHFCAENSRQIKSRLDSYIKHHHEHGISFGHVSDEKGNFMGRAGFYFVPEVNLYEIGYSLLPEYWGKGIATELANALIDYASKSLSMDKICARTIDGNRASDKVLEKTGFTFLGERAFTLKSRLFFWNYYERDNDENLELTNSKYRMSNDDWDTLA